MIRPTFDFHRCEWIWQKVGFAADLLRGSLKEKNWPRIARILRIEEAQFVFIREIRGPDFKKSAASPTSEASCLFKAQKRLCSCWAL
jgi:hypothetical protein